MTEQRPATPGIGDRPHPDAAVKPHRLRSITGESWRYSLGRAARGFLVDDGPDVAAGLTYYGVLAVLPAIIALVSVLGLLGQAATSLDTLLQIAGQLVPERSLALARPLLVGLAGTSGIGWGLALGLAGALWFVSRYVGAFSRAMNRIYGVREGRPLWKLEPQMVVVTIVLGLLCLCATLLLVVSGPLARALGDLVGVGSGTVLAWKIAKWPVLALIVIVVIGLLYRFTPNVRQPRLRWLSPGALLAVLTWLLGSALFGLYVANVGSYDATYGSLAGGVVFLIWLWVSNTALLLGAELDAELERVRELQAGIPAEHEIQLPVRDDSTFARQRAAEQRHVAAGRRIRQRHQARRRPE